LPYSISLGCHIALGIEREGVGVVEGSGIDALGNFGTRTVTTACASIGRTFKNTLAGSIVEGIGIGLHLTIL